MRLFLAGLALVLVAACSPGDTDTSANPSGSSEPGRGSGKPNPPHAPPSGDAHAEGCPGDFNLSRSVREFACDGVWVKPMPRRMVPQGLALGGGSTVYLSGYLHAAPGNRPCQVLQADRDTGRVVARVARIEGRVGGGETTFCRHGGGIGLNASGLWVAETRRLWLLDPAAVEAGTDPVVRAWDLDAPVRGSAMTVTPHRIGLAGFTKTLPGKLRWYDVDAVLAGGRHHPRRHVAWLDGRAGGQTLHPFPDPGRDPGAGRGVVLPVAHPLRCAQRTARRPGVPAGRGGNRLLRPASRLGGQRVGLESLPAAR